MLETVQGEVDMHHYVVSYDICDEKRVKKVFKLLKNFGRPLQYSVFFCRLSDENLEILKSRITPLIDSKVDQVMFIRLRETSDGKVSKNAFSIMGKPVSAEVPDCWIFT